MVATFGVMRLSEELTLHAASHRNYEHPGGGRVTLSGPPGDDAKPYQEREVRQVIGEVES